MSDSDKLNGMIHRDLSASISLMPANEKDDGLMRVLVSASSELPVVRDNGWDDPWVEVLGHNPEEVDLSRFNGGAPLLANHNSYDSKGETPLAGIGKVERAWLENGRIMSEVVISRRGSLSDLRADISDGLVTNVSVGYKIKTRTLQKPATKNSPPEYRVTSWIPFELSFVDIPADNTVGVGRSEVINDLSKGKGDDRMSDDKLENEVKTESKSKTETRSEYARQIEVGVDPMIAERQRAKEIAALGRQHGMSEDADKAIDAGMGLDSFRAMVLDRIKSTGTTAMRTAESPEIGMSEKEVKQFSFCRALLAAHNPIQAHNIAPFEMECSRAAQDKRGDSRDKTREGAITIPVDVLNRGMVIDSGAYTSAMNKVSARNQARGGEYYRDLTVGIAADGGNLRQTSVLAANFIDLLRNAMVLDQLGVTWFQDLNGNIAIPSQTGTATGFWVAENAAPTESQQTIGQVLMSPKTVGAFTDYSRRLLLQSSLDIEMFVRADLANVIAQTIQDAAINGTGASNQPLGIRNTGGIGAVAGGTNGALPTLDHLVDLEAAISNVNAGSASMAYLTNTRVRSRLRKTQEFTGTSGQSLWRSSLTPGTGDVLGYSAYVSNVVPNNLTKGTASGICSAIIAGNFSDLMIGMWGGLDIMLDPYAGATAGTKRVIALQDIDVALRRVQSFAVMADALT